MTENNQQLIVTRGIPGSGKSTWAKRWVMGDPENRVRVNRDDIREELYGKEYHGNQTQDKENRVTTYEHNRIRAALSAGKSVVSDNMHLNPRYLKDFYKIAAQANVPIKNKDFPISLEEALKRNAARERVVDPNVIRKIYSQLGPKGQFHYFDGSYTPREFVKPETKEMAVIFDMDGTLTNIESIRHYVSTPKRKNFDLFHRSSYFCPPVQDVLDMAHDVEKSGLKVIIVTARSETYRAVTEVWLNKYKVNFENMYMRPDGDQRTDHLVKEDILKKILVDYDVVHAVDDRPEVIKVWNSANILSTRVPGLSDMPVAEGQVPHITNLLRSGGCLRCGRPLKNGGTIGPNCAKKV